MILPPSLLTRGLRSTLVVLGLTLSLHAQTLTVTPASTALTIHPGDSNIPLNVSVSGDGVPGPITVTLAGLPSGVAVTPVTLTTGGSGSLQLSASLAADQEAFPPLQINPSDATSTVIVLAISGSGYATANLALTVSLSNPSFAPASNSINLPIVRIDTGGTAVVSTSTNVPGTISVSSADGSTLYLPGAAGTDNTATFHVHGNSTARMPKLPYRINLNTSTDLLQAMGLNCGYLTSAGKPTCDKSSNYVLLANYDDKSLLRDWAASALALAIPNGGDYLASPSGSPSPTGTTAISWWAPHSLFVELYLNGAYEGVYQLIEAVGVDSHKVNIRKMAQTDTSGNNLTGGYLLEADGYQKEDYVFHTPDNLPIGMIAPDFSPETPQQESYISSFVDAAEITTYSANWAASYDTATLADYYIVNEVMGNTDGASQWSSSYFYKDQKNALLYMGPVWDFDRSSGNVNDSPVQSPVLPDVLNNSPWYNTLAVQPTFMTAITRQFNALKRNGVFTAWLAAIQSQAAGLSVGQANNFARWPMLGEMVWPNPAAQTTYADSVAALTSWLGIRIGWMDAYLNSKPVTTTTCTPPSGTLRTGTPVTLQASVTGGSSPGGVVTFLQNLVPLGVASLGTGGTATLNVASLPAGSLNLQAVYNGDTANGLSVSTAATVNVLPALIGTTTNLTSSPANSQPSSPPALSPAQGVTLAAVVIPTSTYTLPTGTVTFSSGNLVLGTATLSPAGIARLTLPALPGGNDLVTASYAGDGAYGSSTSNTLVLQGAFHSSIVTLTPASQTAFYGQPVTVAVQVADSLGSEVPTGTVTLLVDGASPRQMALSSGAASFSLANLSMGQHSFSAIYSGDPFVSASTSGNSIAATVSDGVLGHLDSAADGVAGSSIVSQSSSLRLTGWGASYFNNGALTSVTILVDGAAIGTAALGVARTDIALALSQPAWTNTGWNFTAAAAGLSLGSHCVTAVLTDAAGMSVVSNSQTITVVAAGPVHAPAGYLDQALDVVSGTSTLSQISSLLVVGWGGSYFDNGPATAVHILVDGVPLGNATLGLPRPDVAAAQGKTTWLNTGWSFTAPGAGFSVGPHIVTAVVVDSTGQTFTTLPSTITVVATGPAHAPAGHLEQAVDALGQTSAVAQSSWLLVTGWGGSYYDNAAATAVHILVDGTPFGEATLGFPRPDVAAATGKPTWGNTGWGFAASAAALSVGTHTVTAVIADSLGETYSTAPATITVSSVAPDHAPIGFLDRAVDAAGGTSSVSQSSSLLVEGWGASFYDNGPAAAVHVLVDGNPLGDATLGLARTDVAAAFGRPAWANTGWSFTVSAATLSAGSHTVTAVIADSAGRTFATAPATISVP